MQYHKLPTYISGLLSFILTPFRVINSNLSGIAEDDELDFKSKKLNQDDKP